MKLYHNPRCSKSRQGLKLLQESHQNFEIIEYLKRPISEEEIKDLLDKLKIGPIELVRKNESIWKEKYKGKKMNDQQIIQALLEYPKLIERPIFTNGNKAVIGRPPEKIISIL